MKSNSEPVKSKPAPSQADVEQERSPSVVAPTKDLTPVADTKKEEGPLPVEKNDEAAWARLLEDLRSGGEFEDITRPGGAAIARIKRMGRPGLVKLITSLDHPELQMVRALVAALNYITSQDKPLPNGRTKDQVKTEWENWIKTN
jgi:hypothetical protein